MNSDFHRRKQQVHDGKDPEAQIQSASGSSSGAGNVTRTHDLLITNQLLYRLSYTSMGFSEREYSTAKPVRQQKSSKLPPNTIKIRSCPALCFRCCSVIQKPMRSQAFLANYYILYTNQGHHISFWNIVEFLRRKRHQNVQKKPTEAEKTEPWFPIKRVT